MHEREMHAEELMLIKVIFCINYNNFLFCSIGQSLKKLKSRKEP